MHDLGASLVAQMVKNLQCRRPRFIPWGGEIPWRRKWQATPVFLTGESHQQRSLVGYSPLGHKDSNTAEATEHMHMHDLGLVSPNPETFSGVTWLDPGLG